MTTFDLTQSARRRLLDADPIDMGLTVEQWAVFDPEGFDKAFAEVFALDAMDLLLNLYHERSEYFHTSGLGHIEKRMKERFHKDLHDGAAWVQRWKESQVTEEEV